jgi:ferric-dicitrate binding protein FerR (iron transport regulator)
VNGTAKMKEVDVSLYTSWIDGMLKLEREDLCRVVRRLERYYDIKIQIKDPLVGGYKISGKLDLKNKPSEVLNIIQQTIPIDWGKQKNGDFFIVEPI